jgi:hypothetical protein
MAVGDSGEAAGAFGCKCIARADHGDPLGHRCDRPDQANRDDQEGDTDPYAHLHPLCGRVELGEIGLPYFAAPQCEVVHTVDRAIAGGAAQRSLQLKDSV